MPFIDFAIQSGDRKRNAFSIQTYDQMYMKGGGAGLFGYGGFFPLGRSNSTCLALALQCNPRDNILGIFIWQNYWRTSNHDALYIEGPDEIVIVNGAADKKNYVGNEIDVASFVTLTPHSSLFLLYSHFFLGSFLKDASTKKLPIDYVNITWIYKW